MGMGDEIFENLQSGPPLFDDKSTRVSAKSGKSFP